MHWECEKWKVHVQDRGFLNTCTCMEVSTVHYIMQPNVFPSAAWREAQPTSGSPSHSVADWGGSDHSAPTWRLPHSHCGSEPAKVREFLLRSCSFESKKQGHWSMNLQFLKWIMRTAYFFPFIFELNGSNSIDHLIHLCSYIISTVHVFVFPVLLRWLTLPNRTGLQVGSFVIKYLHSNGLGHSELTIVSGSDLIY